MAAREFRFVQCVIEALCDSIGIDRPDASAARLARRGCSGLASGRAGKGVASADQTAVGSHAGGLYELPAFVRRGIIIPGIEALDTSLPGVPRGRLGGASDPGVGNNGH